MKGRGAVVKAKQLPKRSAYGKGNLRSSLDYYAQDKDLAGEPQGELEAFTKDQDDLSPAESKDWLEHHHDEDNYTYRLTLSPGQSMGEDDLKDWTREVMSDLEAIKGHEIEYLAYSHNDSDHPHAHVLINQDEPLSNQDIDTLRGEASERANDWQEHQELISMDGYEAKHDMNLEDPDPSSDIPTYNPSPEPELEFDR